MSSTSIESNTDAIFLIVRALQLPIPPRGHPPHYLYKYLCSLHHAEDHGPQPEWVERPYYPLD